MVPVTLMIGCGDKDEDTTTSEADTDTDRISSDQWVLRSAAVIDEHWVVSELTFTATRREPCRSQRVSPR